MGVDPPFLYDPPSRYSFNGPTDKGFNPRAATKASWSPPTPKPKPDGPLINFNQHPDSYLIVPYGNLDAKPMSPRTKSKVKYTRQLQLLLRVLALLGSLGILFCVIAIKGTSGSLGWIIRVAPSVALLHTVYAVYHLCRAPTGRTPASSASYMLFASMVDAGLLPFLAFSAFMAHNEHTSGAYGWDTLFGVPLTTWYIVYSTFLLCVVEGGLLLVSLILGIYLAILFRKIAKLPPDMNPLEPNLTARPHKRNKSELVTSDKHMSQTSLASPNRMSNTADPLIAPNRRVPFMHTRTDSAESITLYQNSSARSSRMDVPKQDSLYHQSNQSFRGSYVSVNKSLPGPPSRPQSAVAPSINARQAGSGLEHRPLRSSYLASGESAWRGGSQNSPLSPTDPCDPRVISARYSQAKPINDENVAPVSPVSSGASTPDPDRDAEYMEIKNWYQSPHVTERTSRDYVPLQQVQNFQIHAPQARQQSRGSLYDFDRDLRSPSPILSPQRKATEEPRNPLGMNPPSPPFPEHQEQLSIHPEHQEQLPTFPEHRQQKSDDRIDEPKRYSLYDAPVSLPAQTSPRPKTTSRPSSFLGSGSKGRFYGDLKSPVGSISKETDSASNYSNGRTETMDSNIQVHATDDDDDDYTTIVNEGARYPAEPEIEREDVYEADRKGRVVSNTGYDLSSGYAGLGSEFGRGMGKRREVSGKVAEEGRTAYTANRQGEVMARTNGVAAGAAAGGSGGGGGGAANGFGAAGWARFKGL